uniref:AMP-dependent synthetase/ligase domain-containing protein n=1 Tax=Romanomermis culicivorax TaxID=13658 RepID=A0A915I8G1_ROMCU
MVILSGTLVISSSLVPFRTGHVGAPCRNCKIKLVEITDAGNMGIENVGEICVFGPSVSQGYFRDAEATAKVVDNDGWLHTGDIGMWTDRGTLKIIGRKNSVFKLPHGDFIAPEKIENIYGRSQFVFQIFVYGDNLHDYLVAVVVPDFNNLRPLLKLVLGAKVDQNALVCSHE